MLILVRHGQTSLNAEARLVGRLDPALTDLGQRQAAAAAHWVGATADVRHVVASPLLRASQTAGAFGRDVDTDPRWIELDYGDYDGRALTDVPAELWAKWRADSGYTPPGGESLHALGERVRQACEELVEEAADRDVVVVSHVSPIKAAVAWALGVDDRVAWRMFLGTGSICRVQTGPGPPSLRTFNEAPPPPA